MVDLKAEAAGSNPEKRTFARSARRAPDTGGRMGRRRRVHDASNRPPSNGQRARPTAFGGAISHEFSEIFDIFDMLDDIFSVVQLLLVVF